MLEAVDQMAQEREPNPRLYQMLLGGAAGAGPPRQPAVVLGAFFWKLLAAEGFQPELDALRECGTPEPLVAFDLDQGGLLCRTCRRGVPVSPDALDLMRRDPRRRSRRRRWPSRSRRRPTRSTSWPPGRWSTTSSGASGPSTCSDRSDRGVTTLAERLAAAEGRYQRVRPFVAWREVGDGALLIDTRPREQRRRDGEVPGSVIVGRNVLEWRLDPTSEARQPAGPQLADRVIVLCDEGCSSVLSGGVAPGPRVRPSNGRDRRDAGVVGRRPAHAAGRALPRLDRTSLSGAQSSRSWRFPQSSWR